MFSQSAAITMLTLVLAMAPMVALLMWWLQPQQSLSELIQDARRRP